MTMLHCCTMVMFKIIRMICDGMKVSNLSMLLTAKSKSSIIQQMTAEALLVSLKAEFVAWHRNIQRTAMDEFSSLKMR